MYNRWLKPMLIFILLLAVMVTIPAPAQAAYENTYVNTGNMRDDIVGVALTQVGYREGSNNYTKYGVWFGQPNAPWCGIFISWCANQAGIPSSIIRRNGIASPANFGLSYKGGSSYRPVKGDLFFNTRFTHAGIVYYTEGDYFYTVEGNTNTVGSEGVGVFIRKRKINEYYFSTPNYRGGGGDHNYTTGYDTAHPHKEYKSCSHCSDKYYTGKTRTVDDCKQCIQAACTHQYGKWETTGNAKHQKICSLCEKVVSESHKWKDGQVLQEPNCKSDGEQERNCTICSAKTTVKLSKTDDHTFDEATYLDENSHQMICGVCGKRETSNHIAENWASDQSNHWKACTVCIEIIEKDEHQFRDGCVSSCSICEYVQAGGHQPDDTYACDSSSHWTVCIACGKQVDISEHTYLSDCDDSCQICDYHRDDAVSHSISTRKEKAGHWLLCDICDYQTEIISHTPDTNAKEWETQLCTQCGYVLREQSDHVHRYDYAESDSMYHWGSCDCGKVMGKEVHSWNISSGNCNTCGRVYTHETENLYDTQILIICGCSALCVIGLLVILTVSAVKKRKK